MCNGSIACAGPAVALPLGQQVVQAVPRPPAGAAPSAPQPPPRSNPTLGARLDISV